MQIEEDLTTISQMAVQGKSYKEILAKVPISLSQLKQDLRKIRARWKATQVNAMDEIIARELAKLDLIERHAWEQWDASCTRKTGGDSDYLRVILMSMERRAKLLGIERPIENHAHVHLGENAGQLVMNNPTLREHEQQFWIARAAGNDSVAGSIGDGSHR
jgi:hypothetical protein